MGFFSDIKMIFGNIRGTARLVDQVNSELIKTCGIDMAALPARLQKLASNRIHHAYYNRVDQSPSDLAAEIHVMLLGEGFENRGRARNARRDAQDSPSTSDPETNRSSISRSIAPFSDADTPWLTTGDEETFGTDLVNLVRRVARAAVAIGSVTRTAPVTMEDAQCFGGDLIDLMRRATREALAATNRSEWTDLRVNEIDRERFGEDLVDCAWRVVFDEIRQVRDYL